MDENEALKAELANLCEWKESSMMVEKEWDVQAIGREINAPLGASIRSHILPWIKKIKAELAEARKEMSDGTTTINFPAPSPWICYLSGTPGAFSAVYRPAMGHEPCWFHRKMQELCFGFKWVKG